MSKKHCRTVARRDLSASRAELVLDGHLISRLRATASPQGEARGLLGGGGALRVMTPTHLPMKGRNVGVYGFLDGNRGLYRGDLIQGSIAVEGRNYPTRGPYLVRIPLMLDCAAQRALGIALHIRAAPPYLLPIPQGHDRAAQRAHGFVLHIRAAPPASARRSSENCFIARAGAGVLECGWKNMRNGGLVLCQWASWRRVGAGCPA